MTRIIQLCVAVTLLCIVTACDQPTTPPEQAPHAPAIVVKDFSGQTIELEQPAQRIVALAPHIVENLYTVGAGNQIVGVVHHSDFPAEAANHPMVGGYEQSNFEQIVELKPDLVIAWESGNSHATINKLRELGLPVMVDQPDSLEDIATSLIMLGTVTGHEQQASQAASSFLIGVNDARKQSAAKRQITTFYQVWNEPLISINGHHIISDAIETCGGVNIFADEVAVAPRINIESIFDINPEAIIASGMGEAKPEWLDDWLQWPNLLAVENQNLFYVNPDHLQRHTVRQLFAIERICEQLDIARTK